MSSEPDTESPDENPQPDPAPQPAGGKSRQNPPRDQHDANGGRSAASPAATGPAGALLEGHVGAQYLLCLLTGREALGLPGISVKRVAFQRASLGHPMDDVVVTGVDHQGQPGTLEVQAKRTLSFTASDTVFAEVVALACRSAAKPEFLTTRYELAVALARSSTKVDQHIQVVLRWARDYQDPVEFFDRLNQTGVASKEMRDFVAVFRENMRAAGAQHSDENVRLLLSHFQVLVFDLEYPGSSSVHWARDRCAAALSDKDARRGSELWDSLQQIALEVDSTGGDLNRDALRHRLSSERGYQFADEPQRSDESTTESGSADTSQRGPSARAFVARMQPGLSDIVVDRPSIRSSAIKYLLGKSDRPVALRGMGGSGKTILAAILARNERVERDFPGGVLWATLGQSAKPAEDLGAMLTALGVTAPTGDATASSALLRNVLATRKCLVVVDDVWSIEHVRPFLPGKGGSRLLLTTRDRRICQDLHAQTVEIGALERSQSLQLLKREIEAEQTGFDEEGARAFAIRVGDLALALRLGAVQVRDGRSFPELLEAMSEASSALSQLDADAGEIPASDEDQRRQLSLSACFDVSIRTLAPEIRRAFFLLSILRDDETIDAMEALPIIAATSAADSANVLRVLSRKALLVEFKTDNQQRWQMHDLIHDHARSAYSPRFRSRYAEGVPATLQQAHFEWLERCWNGGNWSACADLRYVDRNLAWHAQMADRPNVVHALMREQNHGKPSWLRRLTQSQLGAQFSVDAQLAAELAHRELVSGRKPAVDSYVDLLWATVARASQISKAQKSSPPLLARLVSEGVIGLRDGLAQIRMRDDLTRAWSYGWLLPHLADNERSKAESQLFSILTGILRIVPESTALEAVAPNASPALRRRLIRFAASVSAQAHAVILVHLLPLEPQIQQASLAEFARRPWRTKPEKRSAYSRLLEAGLKPPGTSPNLLIALAEEPSTGILEYLTHAIPYLPDGFVGLWLDLLQQSAPSYLLSLVQQQQIPLSGFLLKEIQQRAIDTADPFARAALLAATAKILPADECAAVLSQAVTQLCAIQKSDWRIPLQIFRASKGLESTARETLQIEAWVRARDVGFDVFGASHFAELTDGLTPSVAREAAELIRSASAKSRTGCLPHLIAASPSTMTRQLTELLTETTLQYKAYADLKPCIDLLPSDQLASLFAASTALGPREAVLGRRNVEAFIKAQPPGSLPAEVSWKTIFLWATQPELVRARAEEIEGLSEQLSANVQSLETPKLLAFFSDALVNATELDREKLCALIEAIAIPLGQVFDQDQLERLRTATEQACSLYA
jgi:hypothetical protein